LMYQAEQFSAAVTDLTDAVFCAASPADGLRDSRGC
jgi:hypothetical protein